MLNTTPLAPQHFFYPITDPAETTKDVVSRYGYDRKARQAMAASLRAKCPARVSALPDSAVFFYSVYQDAARISGKWAVELATKTVARISGLSSSGVKKGRRELESAGCILVFRRKRQDHRYWNRPSLVMSICKKPLYFVNKRNFFVEKTLWKNRCRIYNEKPHSLTHSLTQARPVPTSVAKQ
ncbi:hypothetical protein D3OALGA1CA_374 [Olavius algarvensis associated proteobacterium Delta 3]|nr:hypothetical protein D3OALGA1CA_374 [Olavius algarvensis associated proteobacterium Delta 3]